MLNNDSVYLFFPPEKIGLKKNKLKIQTRFLLLSVELNSKILIKLN